MSKNKIVYIAGYGRSGSTILDVSLSQHPKVVGLGEITNIFKEWENLRRDDYWSTIINTFEDTFGSDINDFNRITEKYQSLPGFFCNKREIDTYQQVWSFIIEKVGEKGTKILVDSSKTTRLSLFRAKRLEMVGYQLNIVFLKRPFSQVYKSIKKGTNKELEKGKKSLPFYRMFKFFIGYTYTGLTTYFLYGKKIKTLNFNDFTANPVHVLNRLILPIEGTIFYTEKMLKDMDSGIGISGNRLRRKKISGIKK